MKGGRGGCPGIEEEEKKRNIDRVRSFERQNVPKASLPSPPSLTILRGGDKESV